MTDNEEIYVQKNLVSLGKAIRNKDKQIVEQSLKREFQKSQGIPIQQQHQQKQKKEGQKQKNKVNDNPNHYKKSRNQRHLEKHLKSAIPNHQQQFGTNKTRQKFNYYSYEKSFDEEMEEIIDDFPKQKYQYKYDNQKNEDQQKNQNNQNKTKNQNNNNNRNNKKSNNSNNNNNNNYNNNKWNNKRQNNNDNYHYQDRRKSYDELINQYDQDDQYKRNDRRRKNFNNKKKTNKRIQFDKYLSQEQIEVGKRNQNIFEGIYIANEYTKEKATIKCPLFKRKIHINSFQNSNRAMHNCQVLFQVIQVKKIDIEESSEEFDDEESIIQSSSQQQKEINVNQQYIDKEEDWVDVNSDSEDEISDSDESSIYEKVKVKKIPLTKLQEMQRAQLVAKIVGIVKNPLSYRNMVGKIDIKLKNQNEKEYDTNSKELLFQYINNHCYISFKSINKRFGWFNVNKLEPFDFEIVNQQQQQQQSLLEQYQTYLKNKYFAAKFIEWKVNDKYPNVEIIKQVGVVGNIEVECEAILMENAIYDNDFSEKCKEELKQFTPDIITQEKQNRLDLTKEYICTIDPVTARDLDDALSINEIEPGIYEVGVHIADVSHFVQQESEVDKEAILRTTSVYLVQRVIPMLPRILCEELCSLNRNVERLAFSVFFCLNEEGEVLWDRFRATKSVIQSCAQLSYDVVNQVFNNEIELFSQNEQRYQIAQGFDENILKQKVLLLNKIGQKRRQKRLCNSLTFEKSKLRFQLDDKLFPIEYLEEKRGEAQFMVEEYMLLANQFVGKKLIEYDSKTAVLRQHIAPKSEKIDFFTNLLRTCGLNELADNFDVSTAPKLQNTMLQIKQIENEEIKQILQFRLLRLMEAAAYFVVDDTPQEEWRHYALDFDVYTHFTSPIRRYPDILVHRRLLFALEQKEIDQTNETKDKLKSIMMHCNECKLNARRTSDQCDQLFLALYLKTHPVEVQGYILSLNSQYIEIIIPQFNLERKVEFRNFVNIHEFKVENLNNKKEDPPKYELVISYQDQVDSKGLRLFIIKQLQKVNVRLSGTDTFPIEYKIEIKIAQNIFI